MQVSPTPRLARYAASTLAAALLLAAGPVAARAGAATGSPAAGPPARLVASRAAISPQTAAQAAAGWLGRQFTTKGYLPLSTGKPDTGDTALALLAFAAAGVGGDQAQSGLHWLEHHFGAYVGKGNNPGRLATIILDAVALGASPTAFGGASPANNLVARLEATQLSAGKNAGLFGSQSPTYNGAYRQGLALLALEAVGMPNAAGIAWLQAQQCADGGWEAYRSDVHKACSAPDPTTFAGPDTNSSALAVEGLAASGATFPHNPVAFFAAAQNSDGGFGFIGASTETPDANSTSLSIQALVALGALGDPQFTQSGGATPLSALVGFQVGCSAPASEQGAFAFQPSGGTLSPNVLATVQAVPAAAELAFPIGLSHPNDTLPTLPCS